MLLLMAVMLFIFVSVDFDGDILNHLANRIMVKLYTSFERILVDFNLLFETLLCLCRLRRFDVKIDIADIFSQTRRLRTQVTTANAHMIT